MLNQSQGKLNTFAEDVQNGLSSTPKSLSSKYFYDDAGSELFRQIMELPEYYLTQAETEIFRERKDAIIEAFLASHESFDLIELGAGDGTKTAILIEHLLKKGVEFSYSPIDISAKALEILTGKFKQKFPALCVKPVHADYFHGLEQLRTDRARGKIIFFLGSNIGNFTLANSVSFFKKIKAVINERDLMFTGFDLQKDPQIILKAYDDSRGVTAAFNLNLLKRINRELGADFDIDNFTHYAIYNPMEGAARSFLISRIAQTISIEALNRKIHFRAWEPIYMEISQKFHPEMIAEIAGKSGFEVVRNFLDDRAYFTDSLWKSVD